jgi:isopenicillin N synthase-like dioxygenase
VVLRTKNADALPCSCAAGCGCGAHSDSGVLSLLAQAPGAAGLQAQLAEDGRWVDVPPLPGTLVLNTGEALQLATRGYIRATVHRVLPPSGAAARLSAPFFYNAAHDACVGALPLPASLPWARPRPEADADEDADADAARSATHGGRNVLLRCAGMNVFKSFARSHPQAFATHHGDLMLAPDGAVVPRT